MIARPVALALLALTLLLPSCRGRSRTGDEKGPSLAGGGYVSVIDLRGGVPESTVGDGLFPLPAKRTMVGLVRAIDRIADDESSSGVVVRLGQAQFGFAQAAELGRSIGEVRDSGKHVTCHTHRIDNASTWLLQRACSKIWLSAAGEAANVGIAAQITYLKGAFDKIGIETDMLAMGKYKSGGEALTREGPSEPAAENLTNTLKSMRTAWRDGVKGAREGERKRVVESLENGPWTPGEAKERGLVDEIGFFDQALEDAKKLASVENEMEVFGSGAMQESGPKLADLVRLLSGADERSGGRPHIAVVPAVGSITMASDSAFGGTGITAAAMTRTLERLREDESVKAVVLRMDSPGGSPLASDLIWRELMRLREKKPIIASIGSMAASGGYYIVCAANKIVAEDTSIVGSIGVFGGKVVLTPALEKLGVNAVTFAASDEPGAEARATWMSPLQAWDDATRERVRAQMKRIYDLFLERVAKGRGMTVPAVHETAQGEIFTATTGRERGLVDEIGGLDRSLELARELAELDEDTPIVVEGPRDSLLEALLLGGEPGAVEVEAAVRRYGERQAARIASLPAPEIVSQLRPLAAAVAPLLQGEHVVAALPYAIEVR